MVNGDFRLPSLSVFSILHHLNLQVRLVDNLIAVCQAQRPVGTHFPVMHQLDTQVYCLTFFPFDLAFSD